MSRDRVRRPFLYMVVIALLLAACGDDGEEPVATTAAPVETTAAPVETTAAPVETTAAPVETMELSLALSSPHVWIQPVIAHCEGYYEQVGLDVELVRFATGRAATDALIGGQTDLATTAISPAIFAAFQGQPIAILGENARSPGEKVTARAESGISTPADLEGKKIGVTLGTDVHFFLSEFLTYHGMAVDDVEIVNLRPPDMVIALVRGDIDAFASFAPQHAAALEELGDGAVVLRQPDPPIHQSLFLLIGMQDLVAENPEAYRRFMEAMVLADEFAAADRDGATECVAEISEIDVETAAGLMEVYSWKVWLDQSLIDESVIRADWQLTNDLAPEGADMPDFRSFIIEGPLEQVAPDRVSLP